MTHGFIKWNLSERVIQIIRNHEITKFYQMGIKKILTPHSFSFILLVSAGTLSCTNKGESQKEALKPNILILMYDNHSWNHLGCYGNPVLKTPVIDDLAKDFKNSERFIVSSRILKKNKHLPEKETEKLKD